MTFKRFFEFSIYILLIKVISSFECPPSTVSVGCQCYELKQSLTCDSSLMKDKLRTLPELSNVHFQINQIDQYKARECVVGID